MTKRRAIGWTKEGALGVEWADVDLGTDRLSAAGVAIGWDPVPYRLDYELETGPDWVTRRLAITARGNGWHRSLILERSDEGAWTIEADGAGADEVPEAGGDSAAVAGALDCDLGYAPLTNTMPVLRHRLLAEDGTHELLMAFVEVPSLRVRPSRQGYSTIGRDGEGHRLIRYRSLDSTFTSELTFDEDGLVLRYPQLGAAVP